MKYKGFSTLELMIAFAIGSLIIVAVVSIAFGAQYWLVASRTSGEGLYKAKTLLEDLRSAARLDFDLASSSPYQADTSDALCAAGSFCYYLETEVTNLSSCSKRARAHVEWRVEGYGTTSSTLYTSLADPNEIVYLGGDCVISELEGDGTDPDGSTFGSIPGTPTGMDVLNGVAYVTTDTSPYFAIVTESGAVSFDNGFAETVRLNGIDVVRDQSTGRIYAYVARHDGAAQLGIIEVTDPENPVLAASPVALAGASGSYPQGWRVRYFDRRVYITTRETAGEEFHIVDVSQNALPSEIGSGLNIGRTANDLVVRDQRVNGSVRRLVYLPAEADSGEVVVLDVTGDTLSAPVATINLPGDADAMSVHASGNHLFVGRVESSEPELYVFDISNPLSGSFSSQTPSTGEVGEDVTSIRVAGNYALLGSGSNLLIFSSDPAALTEVGSDGFNVAAQALDIDEVTEDGARVYAASSGSVFIFDAI